jgi:hypothetical protein
MVCARLCCEGRNLLRRELPISCDLAQIVCGPARKKPATPSWSVNIVLMDRDPP